MRFLRLALVALALTGCGAEYRSRVVQSPGFSPNGHAVSVFGVYEDGDMSPMAWEELGPVVSSLLGTADCKAGFSEELRRAHPMLFASLQDDARKGGITDEFVTLIAPKAVGDVVMVVFVRGHGRFTRPPPRSEQTSKPSGRMSQLRYSPRMYRASNSPYPRRFGPSNAVRKDERIEFSASLYSVVEGKWLAKVTTEYAGKDLSEARRAFLRNLNPVLSGGSCAGWQWPAPESAARAGD